MLTGDFEVTGDTVVIVGFVIGAWVAGGSVIGEGSVPEEAEDVVSEGTEGVAVADSETGGTKDAEVSDVINNEFWVFAGSEGTDSDETADSFTVLEILDGVDSTDITGFLGADAQAKQATVRNVSNAKNEKVCFIKNLIAAKTAPDEFGTQHRTDY